MKNFTLAVAGLAMAMAASATDISTVSPLELQHKNLNRTKIETLNLGKANAVDGIHSALAQPSKGKKAASAKEIEGEYTFIIGDYYQEGVPQNELEVDGEINFEQGYAFLEWDYYPGVPAIGDYNESTGDLEFFTINLGQYNFQGGAKYYIFCVPTLYNWDTEELEFEDFSATFNEETNTFEFPVDHGFMWLASVDEQGQNIAGALYACDVLSASKVMPDPNWVDYDTAYYVDGWMVPGIMEEDPEPYGWTVTVQQNLQDPNRFRLYNPYRAEGCPILGYAKSGGIIEFSIADPNHVPVFANIWNGMSFQSGEKLSNTNWYGYLLDYYADSSVTNEQIIEYCESEGLTFSTYEDGFVYFEECCWQADGSQPYIWDEETIDFMYGYLAFDNKIPDPTGQTKVAANVAEDGAVEFFNLQGVRVANPQAGQLVIKRQGDKASKIIVK